MWALKRVVYNYSLYKTGVVLLSIITYMQIYLQLLSLNKLGCKTGVCSPTTHSACQLA